MELSEQNAMSQLCHSAHRFLSCESPAAHSEQAPWAQPSHAEELAVHIGLTPWAGGQRYEVLF